MSSLLVNVPTNPIIAIACSAAATSIVVQALDSVTAPRRTRDDTLSKTLNCAMKSIGNAAAICGSIATSFTAMGGRICGPALSLNTTPSVITAGVELVKSSAYCTIYPVADSMITLAGGMTWIVLGAAMVVAANKLFAANNRKNVLKESIQD